MKPYQIVAAAFGGLLALVCFVWLIQGSDFFLYKVFAPAYEDARRETFEQSQAFNDGVAQELAQMQLDYVRAKTPEEKDAIGSLVLHRVAGYDENKLSSDQRAFIRQIKADRGVTQ